MPSLDELLETGALPVIAILRGLEPEQALDIGAALVGAGSTPVGLLLGTGLCGALTTYSTLSYETAQLFERRAWVAGVGNLLGTIVAGLLAVTLGYFVAAAVS